MMVIPGIWERKISKDGERVVYYTIQVYSVRLSLHAPKAVSQISVVSLTPAHQT
jgi:hypothetical protein